MKITYDAIKNAKNIEERGLSFEQAHDFDWNNANIDEDIRHDYPERRFVAIGHLGGRLHVLCFTPIVGGIRVISFRKANQKEAHKNDKPITLN